MLRLVQSEEPSPSLLVPLSSLCLSPLSASASLSLAPHLLAPDLAPPARALTGGLRADTNRCLYLDGRAAGGRLRYIVEKIIDKRQAVGVDSLAEDVAAVSRGLG